MKKVFFILLLILLLSSQAGAAAIPGWPTFYESFEARDVDVQLNDGDAGPLKSSAGLYEASAGTQYVRDDITPRYGTKYLHLQSTWSDPGDCGVGYGYGNRGFFRSYVYLRGDELNDGGITLNVDDGTEYWISWSEYIPVDEKIQIGGSGSFQLMGIGGHGLPGTNLAFYLSPFGNEADTSTAYIRYHNGSWGPYENTGPWQALRGTWVDWVIQARFYSADNANAKFHLYKNGVLVLGGNWDGKENINRDPPYAGIYIVWQLYNTWGCGWHDDDDSCADVAAAYYGCDNTGEWENWTRNLLVDEMRVNEYEAAQGEHYCDVCAPIWAATPTITIPVHEAGGYDTSFSAEFSAYADHRTDAQACFGAYRMNVEVDEVDGDWQTLVYDSGDVSSTNSHPISGLSEETTYQMRVRHSSYNTSTTTEYWGEWSTTTVFTTTTGGEPPGTYTDILQWINFDDGSLVGTTYTLHATKEKYGNDSTGVLVNEAVINSDAGMVGTNGLDCLSTGDYISFSGANDTDCDPAEGRYGAWITVNTWADGAKIFRVYQDADNYFLVEMDQNDELRWLWRDNATSRTTWIIDSTVLEDGDPHFLEFIWDTAGDTREVKIDNVSIDSADANRLAAINDFAGAITSVIHGEYGGAAASDFYLDNIMIANDKNRNFYLLRNETEFPSGAGAEIGAIGSTEQNGTYGINATLTVPVYFVAGEGDPISVVWTDVALPYGYLLTETGGTDLRLYHSSPATGVAASTHWFSTHATDGDYVNSMIAADMASADLTVSSIVLEGGTFTSVMDIPVGENLNDNADVIIDGSSEGLSDATIALCDSDGVAIGANTTISTASTIYASITFANSETGYVSIGPVNGLGMPLSLTRGVCVLTYAVTQPSGWGQGYNEWLFEGTLGSGCVDDGSECVLDGTALTKPAETKIEANGNELSDYDWPDTDILAGFTWRVSIPYPSTSPKEFDSTNTIAAWILAGGYFVSDDFAEATEANAIGTVDLSDSDGMSGHPITIDGGGFADDGVQTWGDYYTIMRMIK